MPEEAMIGREDTEGVATVVDRIRFVMETVGGEEDVHAVTSGTMIFRVEVHDLVGHEGEA